MTSKSWGPAVLAATYSLSLVLLFVSIPSKGSVDPAEYPTYDSLTDQLRQIVSTSPDVARMMSLGVSWQGRDIWAVKVAGPANSLGPTNPGILFAGCIHGDEKIASQVVLTFLQCVLDGREDDEELAFLISEADLWFVPVMNPDGYEANTRKNARREELGWYSDVNPSGVDLNRNFALDWGGEGNSPRPEDPVYRGPYPFSEPESAAIRDLALRCNFTCALSFHSCGELVLYPWSYSGQASEARERLHTIAVEMARENEYDVGQGSHPELSHVSSGDMCDWLHQLNGCLAFTIELGTHQSAWTEVQIQEVVEDNLYLCRTAAKHALLSLSADDGSVAGMAEDAQMS